MLSPPGEKNQHCLVLGLKSPKDHGVIKGAKSSLREEKLFLQLHCATGESGLFKLTIIMNNGSFVLQIREVHIYLLRTILEFPG